MTDKQLAKKFKELAEAMGRSWLVADVEAYETFCRHNREPIAKLLNKAVGGVAK